MFLATPMTDLDKDSEYHSRSSLLGLVEVTCSPSMQTTLLKFSLWVSARSRITALGILKIADAYAQRSG